MKTIFITFCFLVLAQSALTQDYNFGIGLTFQPYFYKNYNKTDWKNRPKSFPVNPKNFNGKAIGITFQKSVNKIFAFKVDLLYSTESQKHAISSVIMADPVTQDTMRYYGTEVITDFNLIKLPIQLSLSKEIAYQSGLFVSVSIGPQISFLTDYISSLNSYKFDEILNKFDYNFLLNHIDHTPNHVSQSVWRENQQAYEYITAESPYIYSQLLFGAVIDLEIQKTISDNFIFGLGGIFEYDFNNSEKHPYWVFSGLGGIAGHNRSSSHNLRYGLQLNLMYLVK
jgi:hypothetical protein